ncbi:histidine phosphatase family protein [Catalinimonas sp. 4WD22]|uniref:histidine phosphatase family protein n=1 Tax=Catalinimonas locisalis TaxID=3133978 RepID=UPI00310175D6
MLRNFFILGILLLLSVSCNSGEGKETQVLLVRHAEKAQTPADDPPLTEKGQRRAAQLFEKLGSDTIQALYSTDYQRTRATLTPISEQLNLPINIYEAHDYSGLAENILTNHAGEVVLVSGHSNTVMPVIEALVATPPIDSISEHDYDYIFSVKIGADGSAQAKVSESPVEQ